MRPLVLRHRLGGYREFAVPEALRGIAECLWVHVVPPWPVPGPAAHRVVPDPGISACVAGCRHPDGFSDVRAVIVGPVTRWRVYPFRPGAEMAGVKLLPEWAEPILGRRAWACADRLDNLTGVPVARDLADRAAAAGSWRETLTTLTDAVVAAARACRPPDDRLRRAAGLLRVTPGAVGLAAERLGSSERQLRRVMTDGLGVSPKAYATLARFVGTVLASDRGGCGWARLAATAGFADQAHLTRDFVRFAGCPPAALAAERRAQDAAWPSWRLRDALDGEGTARATGRI